MMTSGEGLGKVHVITGSGKGKTTAAFGLALRAAGHGFRVCIVQFMKAGETTGEYIASKRIDGIEVLQFGTGRFIRSGKPAEEDVRAAAAALKASRDLLVSGSCQMIVLDEVNVAVSMGLIAAEDVLSALRARRPDTEVVLTGRDAPRAFVEYADYVSVIENKKHPFDEGTPARRGVEW